MDTIEERRVVVELGRERVEQVRSLEHILHAVVDIALVDDGGVSIELVFPRAKDPDAM